METFKNTLYRAGNTYSLMKREGKLALYAVSRNCKVIHYQILNLTVRDGVTFVNFDDEKHLATLADVDRVWKILTYKQARQCLR